MLGREARGRPRQVELDHLRRAGADEEQHLDVGPAGQKLAHHAVQLLVGVGHAGEVALLHDRGGESRLGEDHDARGRLDQVSAGARADDEEEGVLDLAVQPDDARQPAEDLALPTLAQHGPDGPLGDDGGRKRVHAAWPICSARPPTEAP